MKSESWPYVKPLRAARRRGYVFIFKFRGGKIASLREYNTNLLVATRLYKQKLVADD